MSQQLRAAALLKQAADLLTSSNNETVDASRPPGMPIATSRPPAMPVATTTSVPPTIPTASQSSPYMTTASMARAIFAPYTSRSHPTRRGARPRQAETVSFWTHKFAIIPSCNQETVPSREEKLVLHKAGLGDKKITFVKNSNKEQFETTLEEAYPKLKACGGYELMRTPPGSRVSLEQVMMPPTGYSASYLCNESSLGQAVCYIRPIQVDLDIGKQESQISESSQTCLKCGILIPVSELREHVSNCNGLDDVELAAPDMPKRRKMSTLTPICGYTCKESTYSADEDVDQDESGVCPVCGKSMALDLLQIHADMCCSNEESYSKDIENKDPIQSFEMYRLSVILDEKKVWDISVLRRMLVMQAMDELEQAKDEDWNRKLKITFIGEEGLDSGGLTREFLTILFEQSPVFENNVLSFDVELLNKKHYFFMGQMVVMAVISGHPGPRNLLSHVVEFIVRGTTGEISSLPVNTIGRMDAIEAIEEISDGADCDIIEKYGDLLEACGYRKLVTPENRTDAVSALKYYYLFNRFIPSLLQFIEGLKLHGFLEMLKKYPEEGCAFLVKTDQIDSARVKDFFKPVFSEDRSRKEEEELVVFNFHQFLKKIERGNVSCTKVDHIKGTSSEVLLDMGQVLQAFVGCPALPSNITEGLLTFDHTSDQLTTVNTCAPSINFSRLIEIKTYVSFEELMKNIIVGSYGFGRE